ncbi:MAG: Type secretion system protein [Planctomycetota bacterium]|jgi:general secretion pathway protein F/type IV pilus assembly protein PilC
MPQFQYIAVNPQGQRVPGTLLADSRAEALQQLTAAAMVPVSLREALSHRARRDRVSHAALAAAFSLLSDQLDTGVPLLRALQVLSSQSSNQALRSILASVAAQVADGSSLAAALASHPAAFTELDVSMVQAGEEGGFLQESLRRLAAVRERQEEVRSRILSAAAYPILLAAVSVLVVTGMLIFFVPQFQPLFDSLIEAGRLPWPTRLLLWFSDFVSRYSLPLLLCIFLAGVMLRLRVPVSQMTLIRDRLLLRLGGIGPVVRSIAIARFCRVLGALLQNGVPMLRSLEISRRAAGNLVISETIAAAQESICGGRSLAGPLATGNHFPADVLEMIAVAEQANRLESVLLKLADRLELRAQRRLDLVLRMLEPALMLVMAVVVGFMVIALLMPVFEGTGLTP